MSEERKYCENCKKDVSAVNFTSHVAHCARHVTVCQLCDTSVLKAHYAQHVHAQHSTLDCATCGGKVDSDRIFVHEKEECPGRIQACSFCQLELKVEELASHEEYCGARTERCKGCSKFVMAKHLQFHYSSDHKFLTPEDKERQDEAESGDESGEECPICLCPITLPLALECGHVFCMVCVKGIANTTKNCAICRRDIPRDMLMDIRFCREEDVIKNYVNKPKDKKTFRSHSVPGRMKPTSVTRRATTQDYDDMVSHLLSNRTNTSSVRYQRPINTHTPANYTPYSYNSTDNTTSTLSTSNNDDDCCCSSSSSNNNKVSTQVTSTASSNISSVPTSQTIRTVTVSTHNHDVSSDSPRVTSITTVSSSVDPRPRRPTSLALNSSHNDNYLPSSRGPPPNASQEQYDRWLAFQLARADDDIPVADFNRKHKQIMGRSQSMPERRILAATNRGNISSDDSSDSSDDDDDDDESDSEHLSKFYSKRPPSSPRTLTNNSSSSYQSPSSNSSLSTSSRSPSLTKSSSENGSSSHNSTGAKPKTSGLKKKVSFKEEAPEIRRSAAVMLPCEFCNEMFSERDLMRHQTSCDLNETSMPRISRRESPSVQSSPTMSINSPITSAAVASSSSNNLNSPHSPTSKRKAPPNLPFAPQTSKSKSDSLGKPDSLKSPPNSPSPRLSQPSLNNRIKSFPVSSGDHTDSSSSSDSRPTSVSPCPPHSNNSSSSGISSMASSVRSISSTPNSSSSASPIPAIVDTPTDVEADFEDEETPYVKPRRGKLLSSAIGSWRSMSGSRGDKQKYTRSMTAPMDFSEDSTENNCVVNSLSASQLPPLPPRPESTPAEPNQFSSNEQEKSSPEAQSIQSKPKQQVFIKRTKKYRAPAPPTSNGANNQSNTKPKNEETKPKNEETIIFKLDSKPMMRIKSEPEKELVQCSDCKDYFTEEDFDIHKPTCPSSKIARRNQFFRESSPQNSPSSSGDNNFLADDESEHQDVRRFDRAQSVFDDRSFAHRSGHISRTNSIKENHHFERPSYSSMGRRWASKDSLFSQRGDYSSPLSPNAHYANGASVSTRGNENKERGRAWTDHVSMVQEDVKTRLNSAKALIYDKVNEGVEVSSPSMNIVSELRGWIERTQPVMGSSRYRSTSHVRPSSLYSSSGFGSTLRLNSSDYSRSNFGDSLGLSFRRRYIR